jgi:hypothetical protein
MSTCADSPPSLGASLASCALPAFAGPVGLSPTSQMQCHQLGELTCKYPSLWGGLSPSAHTASFSFPCSHSAIYFYCVVFIIFAIYHFIFVAFSLRTLLFYVTSMESRPRIKVVLYKSFEWIKAWMKEGSNTCSSILYSSLGNHLVIIELFLKINKLRRKSN